MAASCSRKEAQIESEDQKEQWEEIIEKEKTIPAETCGNKWRTEEYCLRVRQT